MGCEEQREEERMTPGVWPEAQEYLGSQGLSDTGKEAQM